MKRETKRRIGNLSFYTLLSIYAVGMISVNVMLACALGSQGWWVPVVYFGGVAFIAFLVYAQFNWR